MATAGISSNNLINASSNPIKKAGGQLVDRDLFLKLLTTQLEFQDPFNPLNNNEFTAQLAQFSGLDELYGVNDRLDSLLANQSITERSDAAGLIGKEVKAVGNSVELSKDSSATINYDMEKDAANVMIDIYNSNGSKVRSVKLGAEVSGNQSYVWDGRDNYGNRLEPGKYTVDIRGTDANNSNIDIKPNITGRVTGVNFGGSSPLLSLNGTEVPMENVIEIKEGGI